MIGKIFKLASGVIAAAFAFFIFQMAKLFPKATESVYARGIYPAIAKFFTALTGKTSISIGEVLVYFALVLLVFLIVYILFAFFKPKGQKLVTLGKRLLGLLTTFCILYTTFVFFWGLNYARMPLADSMGLTVETYSKEELISLCESLIVKTNDARTVVLEDNYKTFTLSRSREDILKDIDRVYAENAEPYMHTVSGVHVKKVLTKNLLSTTLTSGIYCPFTFEANINNEMYDLFYPVTAAHEYAHLQGFAREDECNFIAWYVMASSDEPDYVYSAYAFALSYAMNALYQESPEDYNRLYETFSDGVKRDFSRESAYWQAFRNTKIAESSEKIYDTYLHANGIPDGNKSYGRMIDLILALKKEERPLF